MKNKNTTQINCPTCGEVCDAQAFDRSQSLNVLFFPLLTSKVTLVQCDQCDSTYYAKCVVEQFQIFSVQERSHLLKATVDLFGSALAILSLLTVVLPVFGFGLSLYSLRRNPTRGWQRSLSWTTLVIGILISIWFAIRIYMYPFA